MAPGSLNLWMLQRRQDASQVPTCVTTCMANGDTTGCTGVTDYACLCTSTTYETSVGTCWESSCNATEIAEGQAYSAAGCEAFGVTVLPSAATASVTASATLSSSNASATSVIASATSALPLVDVTSAPIVSHQQFINIQAIMSSICGALLIAAIVMAVMSCRQRVKRDYETTQNRTWTGVGTSGYDSKASTSKHGISRNSQRGQTSTFDEYGMTSSNFGGTTVPFNALNTGGDRLSGNNRGFTNRVAVNEDEEYELSTKSGQGLAEGVTEVDSPTASTSRMGESEIELVSTAYLYKGAGPVTPGRAI
ncbi:hypothetical protein BCR39DRAFT_529287 [Naematelia encephala]|uniref:CFEM domain-containing protein n=1 Tax=Naematelia encephala TaxID=71784 RepID=A0A1Y2B8B4_9TREE|nr:hypothetical protein BCR39DRAFT_529287 [Naematelia encephala]